MILVTHAWAAPGGLWGTVGGLNQGLWAKESMVKPGATFLLPVFRADLDNTGRIKQWNLRYPILGNVD